MEIYNEELAEYSVHDADIELFPQEDEIHELNFDHDFNDDSVVSLPPGDSRFGSFLI